VGVIDTRQADFKKLPGADAFNAFKKEVRTNALFFTIAYEQKKEKDCPGLTARVFFPSRADAAAFDRAFEKLEDTVPKEVWKVIQRPKVEAKDMEAVVQMPLPLSSLREALQSVPIGLKKIRDEAWKDAGREFHAKIKRAHPN